MGRIPYKILIVVYRTVRDSTTLPVVGSAFILWSVEGGVAMPIQGHVYK